jgi:hypothetical protein
LNTYKKKIAVKNGIFGVIVNDGDKSTVHKFGSDQEIKEQEVFIKIRKGDPTANAALDKLMAWIDKKD